MMKPDLDDLNEGPTDGAILLKRVLIGLGGGIALIFLAGVIAGYASVVIEKGGPRPVDAAIIGAMVLTGAAIAYGMWRLWPDGVDEPVGPRVRSARRIFTAAVVVSIMLGLVLAIADGGSESFFSNEPVNPGVATLAIAVWIIIGPVFTWLWYQKIDEHEADAYRDSALVAVHAYIFIAPAWWIANRAGWLPPQDPMLVLLGVSLVWMIVWFRRRYF